MNRSIIRLLLVMCTSQLPAQPPFEPYAEHIPGTDVSFQMVPISGGKFLMGSPADEAGRDADEGPQVEVTIEAYWMSVHEVTWAAYEQFMKELDLAGGKAKLEGNSGDTDAVSIPSPTYEGLEPRGAVLGERQPAQLMTHYAARQFTKWLSLKTGHFYRLPTEAEWEYACRAGSSGAYSFGDSAKIDDHAWHFGNANDCPHPVGQKRPNAFGLYDMHGNLAEWVFDQHGPYGAAAELRLPLTRYGQVVRGGSFLDDGPDLRSAARMKSAPQWQDGDPEAPPSLWWLRRGGEFVGMRLVRPLNPPPVEQRGQWWDAGGEWAEDHNVFAERGRLLRVKVQPTRR